LYARPSAPWSLSEVEGFKGYLAEVLGIGTDNQ